MGISVKLETFEGPLDLLLHLIDKNKVNIYDIPIVEITDQYMEYVRAMESQDLNLLSEFLVMAATLLDIKSKMLLPAPENEDGEPEDPRAELVERLLEYKMYKYMSLELKDRELDANRALYKAPTVPPEVAKYEVPINLDELLDGLTLSKLQRIFQSVIRRQEDKVDPIRSKFGDIEREPVSLEDKMDFIIGFGQKQKKFSFRGLLEGQKDKVEVVVTFLAVLELVKTGQLLLRQEHIFDDMYMEVTGQPEYIGISES